MLVLTNEHQLKGNIMNAHFTRTKTAVAVSALLAALAVAPVCAVDVAVNGLGDVAETPYYTVRSGQQTNLSIVNTSSTYVVAVKIRFREALNSVDVRDFDLFLSPNDVWVATIGVNGSTGVPFIQTTDISCTAPTVMPKGTPNTPANRQLGFVNVGANALGQLIRQLDFSTSVPGVNAKAMTEGYIEIIEMGVALPITDVNQDASLLATWAVHGATQNCAALASVYPPTLRQVLATGSQSNSAGDLTVQCIDDDLGVTIDEPVSGTTAFKAEFCEPLNVLKVASNIVRVGTGIVFDAPPTTFANFFSPEDGTEDQLAPSPLDLMSWVPASVLPNLTNGAPGGCTDGDDFTGLCTEADTDDAISRQVFNGVYTEGTFTPAVMATDGTAVSNLATVDAVGSLITATAIDNEWWSLTSGAPQTGWVLNHPTKHYYENYVDEDGAADPFGVGPFPGNCIGEGVTYWNREEKQVVGLVLPSPPSDVGNCREVQTLTFRSGNYFLSQYPATIPLQLGFTSGWARLGFGARGITSSNDILYSGLPTIGFAATTILNGSVAAAYTTPHAYEREIVE